MAGAGGRVATDALQLLTLVRDALGYKHDTPIYFGGSGMMTRRPIIWR